MGAIRMRVQTADLWTNFLERNDGLRIKQLNDEFVYYKHAAFPSYGINWWTGVVWITCGLL